MFFGFDLDLIYPYFWGEILLKIDDGSDLIPHDSIQLIGCLPFIFFACPKKTKQKKRHQRKKSF